MPATMAGRWDPPRTILVAAAAMLAGLAAAAAALDPYRMPLGTPVAVVLGFEAVVDAGLAVAPADRPWSVDRRRIARVVALVWMVFVPVALGLGMTASACACTPPPGYVQVLLADIDPHTWVALGAIAGPPLLGAASLQPRPHRPRGSA